MVLAAAAVAALALRRASAALRHLIWTLALVSALLLPVLSIALPRWQLPIVTLASTALPAVVEGRPPSAPPLQSSTTERKRPDASNATSADSRSVLPSAGPRPSRLGSISWPFALAGIWALGVILIIGRVVVGLIAVQWLARHGQRVLDAPWMKMAIGLALEVGVSSSITFLRSGKATMPMACGVLRPAVMMPAEADEWPAERLRIVLLHELAHVKRRDCLTHLLAQVACACHWFNPLAWIAARHIRTERERACDDLVLAAGTRGPDYADQLLEIARVMRSGRYPGVLAGATLAMAHRSQLEGRLMAILDPRVPHSRLTRLRAAGTTAAFCAAVVPLAALQPWSQEIAKAPIAPVAASAKRDVPQEPSPAPTPAPRPVPVDAGRAIAKAAGTIAGSIAEATVDGTVSGTLSGTLGGTVHGTVHGVLGAMFAEGPEGPGSNVANHRSRENDDQESKPAATKADPRTVAALTAALKDSDKGVRETAMHALVQMRDPAVFEPLLEALKNPAPEVREQAAFGLGQLHDRRAVQPLSAALNDQHADVRKQAAFALGQLRDKAAIPALNAAVKDVSADVREQVIFALGQIRDPAAIEGLTIALRDTSAGVRTQAAFALGQLRDRRAVEPLISAIKDSDADVREQAAFALGQLQDPRAVEALVIALKDSSAGVRGQVAFALGQLRDPRAIDGLTAALKDPQAGVRQQAAFALGQLAR
jgi:HEAT repeat protein/beta-lactamase regulating signal transducer with metallopeptidase domain